MVTDVGVQARYVTSVGNVRANSLGELYRLWKLGIHALQEQQSEKMKRRLARAGESAKRSLMHVQLNVEN